MAISRMQQPRQLYGLGSLVKKAVRGVKKIVKSPIGKAAILGGLGMWGMGAGPFGASGMWKGAKGAGWLRNMMAARNAAAGSKFLYSPLHGKLPASVAKKSFLGNMLGGTKNWWGGLSGGQKLFTGLSAAALATPFLMGKGDDEEDIVEEAWTSVPSSIADIRNQARDYYRDPASSTLAFMPQKQFVQPNFYAADGGRAGLMYGGNPNEERSHSLAGTHVGENLAGGDGSNNNNNPGADNTVTITTPKTSITPTSWDKFKGWLTGDSDEVDEDGVTQDTSLIENTILGPATKNAAYDLMNHNIQTKNRADEILAGMNLREGGRVGLLNGGEAGQEQIEQMLMAEFVKYKNQGGTLTFEQFVQAIMQQQQGGGMEQPQEVAMAANGGRIGYAGGQLVTPSSDGSRPGYRGFDNIFITPGGDQKRIPPRKFDFFKKTGPITDEQKKLLQNMSDEDKKMLEEEGGGILDILIDILKIPYVIRGGETDEPLFSHADGGRIGAYNGGLMSDEDDEYNYNPYKAMAMYKRPGKQEGGIMETDVAEEMIDMGGQEKDYRETGGFVEIGRKERADDVPARLSKNEFVFTADAVRAAGGGDIDAGSEVMQNMMDNLEAGGEISEESQGLEGAQAMYDQQQMLQSRIA